MITHRIKILTRDYASAAQVKLVCQRLREREDKIDSDIRSANTKRERENLRLYLRQVQNVYGYSLI